MRFPILHSMLVLVLGSSPHAFAEDWPAFRGPTYQGTSLETNLPLTWSVGENVVWKTVIPGEGWSSPIIWGDLVFLTTATDGGTRCHVLALQRQTGTVRWDREVFQQVPGHRQERNSYASPTPCTDGQRVYACFGDGSFVAVDFEGQTVWTNRAFPFYGEHGLATSAILHDDLLIMARDGSSSGEDKYLGWKKPWGEDFVLALDKNTGQLRWRAQRGLARIAHCVPGIWTAPDGQAQVVSEAGDVLQGFDARTGKLIWTSECIGEGPVPSAVLGEGLAFTCGGWHGRDSIKAFRLGGVGDLKETNLVWEQRKSAPKIPSLLYLKPFLYGITDGGVAICLRAATGEVLWQERIGGNFAASPVANQDRLYFLSDEGETTVIATGSEFKILARNALHEKCQASLAVAPEHLFIRTLGRLYCIGPKFP